MRLGKETSRTLHHFYFVIKGYMKSPEALRRETSCVAFEAKKKKNPVDRKRWTPEDGFRPDLLTG